jgi:hypothetical protein
MIKPEKRILTIALKLKRTAFLTIAATSLLRFLAGCGDGAAQQLARDTSKSVSALSQQVDTKVNAEKGFYATEQAAILNRDFGCSWCTASNSTPPVGKTGLSTTPSSEADGSSDAITTSGVFLGRVCPKESLYYLTMANNSQSDADMGAAKIIATPKDALSIVLTFQQQGLDEQSATYAQLLQQYQDTQKQLSNVQQIQEQADKLTAIRNDLATLASSNTPAQNLTMLYTFGSAVESQIQNGSKGKQPASAPSSAAPQQK